MTRDDAPLWWTIGPVEDDEAASLMCKADNILRGLRC